MKPIPEERSSEAENTHTGTRTLLLVLLLGLIAIVCVLAAVPPVSRDALIHHLAVPKIYLHQGGMIEMPDKPFSYYPMNLQLLYLVSLALGHEIVPKYIHFAFALLTAWLLYRHLAPRMGKEYGLLGALFFLSLPIVVKLSSIAYVDLGLVFFSTAALLCVITWLERGFRKRDLVKAGVFCGLAMGTKYNGLLTFLILVLFIPFIHSRCRRPGERIGLRSLGQAAIFAAIALAVFSPWAIRNLRWTANPVYPLMSSWFADKDTGCGGGLNLFTMRAALYSETWIQMALLPVRVFLEGQDGDPQHFDGRLNPVLLFLAAAAFLACRKGAGGERAEKRLLLLFAGLYFTLAFFSAVLRIRYILPMVPPLVILSMYGLRNCGALNRTRRLRWLAGIGLAAVAVALGMNASYVVERFRWVEPLSFLSKKVSREAYIARFWPEYPALGYINRHLPADARILFIFNGHRGYYCDRAYRLDMPCGRSLLARLTREAQTARDIHAALAHAGITHLLIRRDLFEPWVAAQMVPAEKQRLARFFRNWTHPLYTPGVYGVYALVKETDEASTGMYDVVRLPAPGGRTFVSQESTYPFSPRCAG